MCLKMLLLGPQTFTWWIQQEVLTSETCKIVSTVTFADSSEQSAVFFQDAFSLCDKKWCNVVFYTFSLPTSLKQM